MSQSSGITISHLQEICQSPELFSDNINLAHAKQGLLGDCWFLCASNLLLTNIHLLNKVEQQLHWSFYSILFFDVYDLSSMSHTAVLTSSPSMNLCRCCPQTSHSGVTAGTGAPSIFVFGSRDIGQRWSLMIACPVLIPPSASHGAIPPLPSG